MKFKDLVVKNFKYNFKRYISLFLCTSFTIMVLFILLDLEFNREFKAYIQNDKSINSIMMLAIFILVVFSSFFIIYSQTYFIKSRSKEFGVFLTIGMTKKNLNLLVLIENIIISTAALAAGLISGAILTRLFFLVIIKVSKFDKIKHHFNVESFMLTAILFTIIFWSALLAAAIFMNKLELSEIIKSGRKRDRIFGYHPTLFILGIILLAASVLLIAFKVKEPYDITLGKYMPISIILCLISLYLIIAQVGSGVLYILRRHKKVYYKNLITSNEIYYRINMNKGIIFSSSLLIGVSIFGIALFYFFDTVSVRSVPYMYPYNIAYNEYQGINYISKEKLDYISNTGDTALLKSEELQYCIHESDLQLTMGKGREKRNLSIAIVSQKRIKEIFSKDYLERSKGSAIELSIEDGQMILAPAQYYYKVSKEDLGDIIGINSKGKAYKFKLTNFLDQSIYFINIPDCDYLAILNDKDYNNILSKTDKSHMGIFHMLSFEKLEKTEPIINRFKASFSVVNLKLAEEQKKLLRKDYDKFSIFSTFELYKARNQSGTFSNFIAIFVSFLFFIAASTLIYFKLHTELEDEKNKYKKLFKLGMNEREFKGIINKQLIVIFFSPLVFGGITAYLYLYSVYHSMGAETQMYISSLKIFFGFIAIQLIFYFFVSRRYVNKIICNI